MSIDVSSAARLQALSSVLGEVLEGEDNTTALLALVRTVAATIATFPADQRDDVAWTFTSALPAYVRHASKAAAIAEARSRRQ